MTAFLVPLLGLIGKLVEIGAKAYQDAQKQHDDVVAAYQSALEEAKNMLDTLKAAHDERMATAKSEIAAASRASVLAQVPSPDDSNDPTS